MHLFFLITYPHEKSVHGGFYSVIPSVLKDLFLVSTNAATYATQQIGPASIFDFVLMHFLHCHSAFVTSL